MEGTNRDRALREAKESRKTVEPQYDACMEAEPVTLGPMASEAYRRDPKRLAFTLARYKFVSKMLAGMDTVAEVGCGDGFGSRIVAEEVRRLDLYDFDKAWKESSERATGCEFRVHDIVRSGTLPMQPYDAIFMLDVAEHIPSQLSDVAMYNVARSLTSLGVAIIGCPSLESQAYASKQSLEGHVNCRTAAALRSDLLHFFGNVFVFSMSDEVVHTGFFPMAQYLIAVCAAPSRE